MASPVKKRKEFSGAVISSTISENQQRSRCSFVKTSFGTRRHCWICADVWMDILPLFDRAQLGLKLALISPRFDVLVDAHFNGKSELTIWRRILIRKDKGMPKLYVLTNYTDLVSFPLPDHPLPNKIRFRNLHIKCFDHSVIAFLRANQKIFEKGTNLCLHISSCFHDGISSSTSCLNNAQPICDVFAREIWPIFAPNIRRLDFRDGYYLDNLRRRISPTILTELNNISVISSGYLLPNPICDDGPNATAGQALSKWLHIPSKNGQPKRLRCFGYMSETEFVNIFKEKFIRATTSASYEIYFGVDESYESTPLVPFELVNKRTNEKLTLMTEKIDVRRIIGLMKRYPIGYNTVADQWEKEGNSNNLNNVNFMLCDAKRCNGPLSPPATKQRKMCLIM